MKVLLLLLILSTTSLISQDQPNIVLILADDLGYGEIGKYSPYNETPNIDFLMDNGLVFERFYVHSQCSPTRSALMTGKYAWRMGLNYGTIQRDDFDRGIPSNITLLPQKLKELGYITSIIGKWHLGNEPDKHPNVQGFFDYQFGLLGGSGDYFTYKQKNVFDLSENGVSLRNKVEGYITEVFQEKSVEFIKQASGTGTPFFLYIPLTTPHGPFQCKEEDLNKIDDSNLRELQSLKKCMVESMDTAIGEILNELKRQNIENETLVIFLSDNGATETHLADVNQEWNAPFRGSKGTYYEGGINVPCVFYYPGTIEKANIDPLYAGHVVDLYPTIVEFAGGEKNGKTDGLNLVTAIKNLRGKLAQRPLYLDNIPKRTIAIFKEGYKLLRNPTLAGVKYISPLDGDYELYDLTKDIEEKNNLFGQGLEIEKSLLQEQSKISNDFYENKFNSSDESWFQNFCFGVYHRLGFWKDRYTKEVFIADKRK